MLQVMLSWMFVAVQKCLQNDTFSLRMFRGCSPTFAWVGVLLVYTCSEDEGDGPRSLIYVFLPTRAIARLSTTTTTSRAIRAVAARMTRVRSLLAATSGCIMPPTS